MIPGGRWWGGAGFAISGGSRIRESKNGNLQWLGPTVRRQAGKRKDFCSIPLLLSLPFRNCDLWTLSCGFYPHN